MCTGRMEIVYDRQAATVVVCVDCHCGVTIPSAARDVVRLKREGKWEGK